TFGERAALRINDRDLLASPSVPAVHEGRIGRLVGDLDAAFGQSRRPNLERERTFVLGSAGYEQRSLRKAIAGIERLSAEAAPSESRSETLQRCGADRLCAAKGERPTRQVELRALLRRDSIAAEIVGEVWGS